MAVTVNRREWLRVAQRHWTSRNGLLGVGPGRGRRIQYLLQYSEPSAADFFSSSLSCRRSAVTIATVEPGSCAGASSSRRGARPAVTSHAPGRWAGGGGALSRAAGAIKSPFMLGKNGGPKVGWALAYLFTICMYVSLPMYLSIGLSFSHDYFHRKIKIFEKKVSFLASDGISRAACFHSPLASVC
jgi:hypothetical protein